MSTLRIPSASGANSGTLNAAKGALAGAGVGAAAGSSSNKSGPKTYPFWLGGKLILSYFASAFQDTDKRPPRPSPSCLPLLLKQVPLVAALLVSHILSI